MKIIIGADLVPTVSNYEHFESGNLDYLFGAELLSVLSSADYCIFNLECPLVDHATKINKSGPSLSAPKATIKGIAAIQPSLLILANNHILDYGQEGLSQTTQLLQEYDIPYIGAGENIHASPKAHIWSKSDIRIGVYACTENEFSVATSCTPGANPFDPLETMEHIANLRSQCDYLIVIYHGGKEHYRYPTPALQKVFRKMIDNGADLVVNQHSHCIGCQEQYNNALAIYGQGNFIFDYLDNIYWQSGLLVEITISHDKKADARYLPLIKENNTVRLAKGEQAAQIMHDFHQRSSQILDQDFVNQSFKTFVEIDRNQYIRILLGRIGRSILIRIMDRLTHKRFSYWVFHVVFGKKDTLALLNCIRCESHREMLQNILDIE